MAGVKPCLPGKSLSSFLQVTIGQKMCNLVVKTVVKSKANSGEIKIVLFDNVGHITLPTKEQTNCIVLFI